CRRASLWRSCNDLSQRAYHSALLSRCFTSLSDEVLLDPETILQHHALDLTTRRGGFHDPTATGCLPTAGCRYVWMADVVGHIPVRAASAHRVTTCNTRPRQHQLCYVDPISTPLLGHGTHPPVVHAGP